MYVYIYIYNYIVMCQNETWTLASQFPFSCDRGHRASMGSTSLFRGRLKSLLHSWAHRNDTESRHLGMSHRYVRNTVLYYIYIYYII